MNVSHYAKALVGCLLAGLTALGTALTDGAVTPQEWVAVAVAALGTLAGVYATNNSGQINADDRAALERALTEGR